GIDSTALFFLMLKKNIAFDIAIVDYNQRLQSKDEVIYATQLAHKYNKKCFISSYPEDLKFSEKNARDFRYNFFDEIMLQENYEALLTAHQLNDKLEWFLMQFTKGAGLTELIGMEEIVEKNNYKVLKPLLHYTKNDLQKYLDDLEIKYFVDQSNYDEKYKRNYFRHHFSDQLLDQFSKGILNSFQYLEEDNRSLLQDTKEEEIEELTLFTFNGDLNIAIKLIDQELKKRGILISKLTRKEIKEKKEVVVSHKIAIAIIENRIYIVPYVSYTMDKKFKEKCRVQNIPKNIRSYIFKLYKEGLFIL
ncbi:MAG: tRNA lysidine(34) synthetase TilS, partial [Arcobacteraceae bacterium]